MHKTAPAVVQLCEGGVVCVLENPYLIPFLLTPTLLTATRME